MFAFKCGEKVGDLKRTCRRSQETSPDVAMVRFSGTHEGRKMPRADPEASPLTPCLQCGGDNLQHHILYTAVLL